MPDYSTPGGENVEILQSIIDGTKYDKEPTSEISALLIDLKGSIDNKSIAGLADVEVTNPSEGQVLAYDATEKKWVNGNVSGGGFEYKNRESVPTGNTWIDGRPIKVFCFYYNASSGSTNSALLSDFGFNDTINNVVDIRGHYVSQSGESHAIGGNFYAWYSGGYLRHYQNLNGTAYFMFYYT